MKPESQRPKISTFEAKNKAFEDMKKEFTNSTCFQKLNQMFNVNSKVYRRNMTYERDIESESVFT